MRGIGSTMLVLASALMLAPQAAQAGKIYRWVDTQGKVHYGDQPLPQAQEVKVGPPGGAAAGTAALPGDGAPVAGGPSGNCQERRDQLALYRKAPSIVEKNALGVEHAYSEDERSKLIEMTERSVNEACGGS